MNCNNNVHDDNHSLDEIVNAMTDNVTHFSLRLHNVIILLDTNTHISGLYNALVDTTIMSSSSKAVQ